MAMYPTFSANRYHIVAIGASTGSPTHLEDILSHLPADLPCPILVALHIPPRFSTQFANACNHKSAITIVEAEDGMPLLPGTAYIGKGHHHMRVIESSHAMNRHIQISKKPEELPYKPSADELLRTCAEVYKRNTLGIIFSGIGKDGLLGATAIHEAGGTVITQSEKTCAVYGMPRSCDEAGISSAQLDPDDIAKMLLQLSPSGGKLAAS